MTSIDLISTPSTLDRIALRTARSLIENLTDVSIRSNRTISISTNFFVSMYLSSFVGKMDSNVSSILSDIVYNEWKNYGFRYFPQDDMPEDLDTASAVTRLLSNKTDVVDRFLTLLQKYENSDGFVPTFLSKDVPKWMPGADGAHHLDVSLNSFLTLSVLGEIRNPRQRIHDLLESTDGKYFWYLQDWYIAALYNKIAAQHNLNYCTLDDADHLIIDGYSIQICDINSHIRNMRKMITPARGLLRIACNRTGSNNDIVETTIRGELNTPFLWSVGYYPVSNPHLASAILGV